MGKIGRECVYFIHFRKCSARTIFCSSKDFNSIRWMRTFEIEYQVYGVVERVEGTIVVKLRNVCVCLCVRCAIALADILPVHFVWTSAGNHKHKDTHRSFP